MAYLIFNDKLYKVPFRLAKKILTELTEKKVKKVRKRKRKVRK